MANSEPSETTARVMNYQHHYEKTNRWTIPNEDSEGFIERAYATKCELVEYKTL